MSNTVKGVVVHEMELPLGIPVALCALENGNLVVRTDRAHEHLLPNIEDHLNKEGWIEHYLLPENHPYLEGYSGSVET